MTNKDLFQVVVRPYELNAEQAARLANLAKEEWGDRRMAPSVALKRFISFLLHPAMHHWVRWREYDPISDRLLEMGWTCEFCPLSRYS